jgi:hypothetical protein
LARSRTAGDSFSAATDSPSRSSRETLQQVPRSVQLACFDGDLGADRDGKRQAGREVTLVHHTLGDSGRRVGLGKRTEPQLEESDSAVHRDQAARASGATQLRQHRVDRLLDGVEALADKGSHTRHLTRPA